MPVTMTAYDITTALGTLGANPITPAEMDTVMGDVATTVIDTRPYHSTSGSWASGQSVGYDITESTNIALLIDYTLTITADDTYEFNIDSDDYADLYVDGTLVSYEPSGSDASANTPIALTAGSYTLSLRLQQGTGAYSFYITWRKQGEADFYELDPTSVNLSEWNRGVLGSSPQVDAVFQDYPHKLTVKTELDGVAIRRRVEIRNRINGDYVASKLSDPTTGVAAFTHLPTQLIDEPHIVTCFDDRTSGYLNALVYDRIYQVSDQGFPPEN